MLSKPINHSVSPGGGVVPSTFYAIGEEIN